MNFATDEACVHRDGHIHEGKQIYQIDHKLEFYLTTTSTGSCQRTFPPRRAGLEYEYIYIYIKIRYSGLINDS